MRLPEDPEWTAYRARFAAEYDEMNYQKGLQHRVMRAGHRFLEKTLPSGRHYAHVLEVGAGTGEHVPFIQHGFDTYTVTDLDPQALAVARRKAERADLARLSFVAQNAARPAQADASVDRLIAAHVLEHLERPHEVIKTWRDTLRPGGVLSVLLPTDPGLAWRLGRCLGPRRQAEKKGLPYDYIMAREHINACYHLLGLLRHYFPDSRTAWWPLGIPSTDLNLFVAIHAER